MSTEPLTLIVSPAATVGGVVLGWYLGARTARRTATDERRWIEQQTVRDRQDAAAAELDKSVVKSMSEAPRGVEPARHARPKLEEAGRTLLQAWSRVTVLNDAELERRVNALDMALHIGAQHALFYPARQRQKGLEEDHTNYWALTVAYSDLRRALAAFQRREPLPPPQFPTAKELVALSHPRGRDVGLEGVTDWLVEHGATG